MAFSIRICKWHGVAAWTWDAGDDVCGICRSPFDGCPPDGKYPGDDSPVIWGVCEHAFHIQCINKWLASSSEQRCPMCRRAWEYKSGLEGDQPGPEEEDRREGSEELEEQGEGDQEDEVTDDERGDAMDTPVH
uniref:Anaphase-promoting complex subunit 11 n=1 Tax=Dunaliella tertiolecta TaxID=3047 RepID=A0A7S3VUG1_DUNTE|mmetsp:Transcript_3574/g.9675  ORF Transcript_3574/g.9675 Transcript_3574/m.9675 type:complete len:133 (-) Transcript_3574:897-1295(-)|eukprot:CAMPEP_0202339490 /NCGR_PEP_ID=MMETSP1126-20121109/1329_1 /ASSEMBLY_ACC=CAM_ASM_000457 /TAXON_ID=3047 /ORGANISM="Dunaliella tertiolecta, Strain CCMP1320" /LENGTH=132 /DNA_ID=CAMNT_0048930047 /DNA_START=17 /DNA_END=415 /DNA_ORIENTATION=+